MIRAALLGHASFLVEAGAARVLMDPVFFDPFERETVGCPARVVHRGRFPTIDAVFLSHGHLDHFDLRSLSTLPRGTPIYVPPDDLLREELWRAEFRKVTVVRPRQRVAVKELTVVPTASKDDFEHGLLLSCGGATLWNQVDTVVQQPAAVAAWEDAGGKIDVAVCSYNPLLEYAETWVSEQEFPRERYERLLEVALMSRAETVVPGSSGQRVDGPRAWVNHRVFPVSREQFVRDLRDIAPEQRTLVVSPGEALVIDGERPALLEKSPYAETLRDDTDAIAFDPERWPAEPLRDPNRRGYAEERLRAFVHHAVEHQLVARMRALQTPRLMGPLRTLWDRRAAIAIEVVYPSGAIDAWHLARWTPQVEWARGPHPRPDYLFGYAASDIYAFLHDEHDGWPELRAQRFVRPRGPGEPYRLRPLDPGRLHGVDLYNTVDETYWWTPLIVLTQVDEPRD